METKTSFDLNREIQQWCQDLSQSPALRHENLAELEAHLRDSVATLAEKGLSPEEAFLIAVRRCGNRKQLQAEFSKPTLFETWLFRLIWIFISLSASFSLASAWFGQRGDDPWINFTNPFDVGVPLVLFFFVAIAAGNAFLLRRAHPRAHRQVPWNLLYWLVVALFVGSLTLAGSSAFQIFCASWLSGLNAPVYVNDTVLSAILPAFGFGVIQIVMLILLLANLAFTGRDRLEPSLKLENI